MYKRRDWLMLHGAEGPASDSSDDNSSEADGKRGSGADGSSGSEDEAASEGPDEDEGVVIGGRLEDLSEDDLEGNDWETAETQQELEEQLGRWVQSKEGEVVKGRPLKCRLCSGVLILNAKALRQHLESRKHMRRVDKAEQEGLDPGFDFCFADDYKSESDEGETHYERMERVQRELEAARQQQDQQQTSKVGPGAKKKKKKQAQKGLGAAAGGAPAGEQQQQAAEPPLQGHPQQQKKAKEKVRKKAWEAAQAASAGQGADGANGQGEQHGGDKRPKQQRKRPGKRQRAQAKEGGPQAPQQQQQPQQPLKMNSKARRQEARRLKQQQAVASAGQPS
ncbi:hypothetical protein N2152v2_010442 [Parachlorella kessleri]